MIRQHKIKRIIRACQKSPAGESKYRGNIYCERTIYFSPLEKGLPLLHAISISPEEAQYLISRKDLNIYVWGAHK